MADLLNLCAHCWRGHLLQALPMPALCTECNTFICHLKIDLYNKAVLPLGLSRSERERHEFCRRCQLDAQVALYVNSPGLSACSLPPSLITCGSFNNHLNTSYRTPFCICDNQPVCSLIVFSQVSSLRSASFTARFGRWWLHCVSDPALLNDILRIVLYTLVIVHSVLGP